MEFSSLVFYLEQLGENLHDKDKTSYFAEKVKTKQKKREINPKACCSVIFPEMKLISPNLRMLKKMMEPKKTTMGENIVPIYPKVWFPGIDVWLSQWLSSGE